jgi:hypothetical integral membrane protein (TIGR02206 family)
VAAVAQLDAFGPAHLALLGAVPAAAGLLAVASRRRPGAARPLRLALAAALAATEAASYAHALALGWIQPPRGLPLDLCDVAAVLAIAALVRPRPRAVELLYYVGVAGSGMALLTPDLGVPWPSFAAIAFFASHGGVVAAALLLVWSGAGRPGPGSWLRAWALVNAYAAAIAVFDAAFGTNYMYLCRKPAAASLLDLLGPWPWYLVAADAVALALFAALYAPFRRARA